MLRQFARRVLRPWARRAGYDIVRAAPAAPVDTVTVPRYLVPSGHKLIDFRQEPGFQPLASQVISAGRTLLDYNRLLTLWHAVRNTSSLGLAAAEVGTYRGGSAWFLAAALRYWQAEVPLHVIDTFSGHPDMIEPSLDGPHEMHLFGDTSLTAVREYLAPYANIVIHPGEFSQVSGELATARFQLVHLDVDLYQSAVAALEFFWPRLSAGGVIVIDDYGFITCRGMKTAVDDFVNQGNDCALWYVHTGQVVLTKQATIG